MTGSSRITAAGERALFSTRLGLRALGSLSGAGLIAPVRPDRLVRIAAAPLRLGPGLALLAAVAAARHPDDRALVDERGTLTYGVLDRRAARIAAGLQEKFHVGPGDALAVMCRNHRGYVEAALAASRTGADLVSLNTEFPGPQLARLLDRRQPAVVVHDEEFGPALDAAAFAGNRVTAWHDGDPAGLTLDALAARPARHVPAARRQGRLVLLTSGTTGTPKSAPRDPSGVSVLGPATTLLSQLPVRAREPMLIAPPLFHGFGFAFLALALFLGSTIVVRRKFDAEAVLAAIEEHRVTTVVAVPVMLRRMLQLPEPVRGRYDTTSLRAAVSAAAPLGADLSTAFMDQFGDVLYDIYGTTEVGFGAMATPADLRAAPGTVGRPPFGTTVKILDEDRGEVPPGRTGHIFVGGALLFEGYAGGDTRETVDGFMNTGDLGHLDRDGRLFIDGREDDMIVSGGENVFPQEVEGVLRGHPAVADVAVFGVEDAEFGQRLQAFVVLRAGAEISGDELKAHVSAKLERFKVPRDVVFLDELPRNPIGKVLRSRLPSRSGMAPHHASDSTVAFGVRE